MEALQALLTRDIVPHSADRMVENFHPEPDFFTAPGRTAHKIDSNTLARWGFDTTDSIEYIYMQKSVSGGSKNCSNDKPTRMRLSIYDAQGLKEKLTSFITELVAAGAHYSDPEREFVQLSRFGTRNMAEDTDLAKRNAALDPDIQVGNVNGRFVFDVEKRQYKLWILNPCGERAASRYSNWFGPTILLTVPGMVELVNYIDIATAEIKRARGT